MTMASSAIMKEASEVTPSAHFLAVISLLSCMILVSAWNQR
jgi:hypothetical protein